MIADVSWIDGISAKRWRRIAEKPEKFMKLSAAQLREFIQSDFLRAGQKYFLVGGACALIDWALFALFLYWSELQYLVAGSLAFMVATTANYYMSVRFVFGTGRRSLRQRVMLLYCVSLIGLVINLSLLMLGFDFLNLHPMIAKILATGVVFAWNFLLRYYLIFQR